MAEIQSQPRELFGGAITLNIPQDFIDVSNIRQVPNTQEVFVDPTSDLSLVVELLQRVEKEDDTEAIKFHFNALADDNSALNSQIFEIKVLDGLSDHPANNISKRIALHGQQEIQKFNKVTPDNVLISLALLRLDSQKIDIVISVNEPSSSGLSESNRASKIFSEAVSSFLIRDFGLFA